MVDARASGPAIWWALLGCLVTSAVVLGMRGAPWAGEWAWTLDNAADTTTLSAPVVATFSAWIAYRWRGVRSIADSSARGYLVAWDAAATGFTVGVVALLLSAATAVAYTVSTGPVGGPVRVIPFAPAVLILAVAAAAGALAGTLVPHLLAVAVCPFATFIVASLGFAGIGPPLLRVDSTTGGLAGLTFRPAFLLAQTGALLGLAASLVLGLLVVRRAPLGRPILVLGLVLSASAFVTGSGALMHNGERLTYSGEAATDCSTPANGPLLCSLPSHRRSRTDLAPYLARFTTRLRRKDFPVPNVYSELGPMPTPSSARGELSLSDGSSAGMVRARPQVGWAADSAARPAQCGFWYGAAPVEDEVYQASLLLSEWILADAGYDVEPLSPSALHWLDHAGIEATAWARQTYAALRTCNQAMIRLPAGVSVL